MDDRLGGARGGSLGGFSGGAPGGSEGGMLAETGLAGSLTPRPSDFEITLAKADSVASTLS